MHLNDVAGLIGGKLFGENISVSSVSIDSRTILPGQIFLAISGPNFDGNEFVTKAEDAGAVAAIVERQSDSLTIPQVVAPNGLRSLTLFAAAYRKLLSAKVCAITGSSGKTSVKGMLRSICLQDVDNASHVVSTYKNFNNHIGVPLTLLAASNDSKYLIVEAGTSGKGEIKPLADIIDADVAVVNNIGPSHIEAFGALDEIAKEKANIFTNKSNNAECVLNADDAFFDYFQDVCSANVVLSFSTNTATPADMRADDIKIDRLGQASFRLHSKKHAGSVGVSLNVLGRHHVNNALAAASCATSMGLSLLAIQKGLESFMGEPGRMQCHRLKHFTLIDDSYNANPESMGAAIQFLSGFEQTILVLGDMAELGNISIEEHKKIGALAKASGIKELFAIGKFSKCYADGFGAHAQIFENHHSVVNYLRNKKLEEATILVKGSRSAKMDYVVNALVEFKEIA